MHSHHYNSFIRDRQRFSGFRGNYDEIKSEMEKNEDFGPINFQNTKDHKESYKRESTVSISCFGWFNKREKKTLFDILNEEQFGGKNLDVLKIIIEFTEPTKAYTIIMKERGCHWSPPKMKFTSLFTDAIEMKFNNNIYRNEFNNVKNFILYYCFYREDNHMATVTFYSKYHERLLRYYCEMYTLDWFPSQGLAFYIYKSRRLVYAELGVDAADDEWMKDVIELHFLC